MILYSGLRVANYIMTYLSLYFGWEGAPGNWGVVSSLLMQFVAAHKPTNAHTHGPESFEAFQFVDDGGFAEPALGLRPWMCVGLWERGLRYLLGWEALNRDKKRVEGIYSTESLMWEVLVDTKQEIVALPADKILKAQNVLADPLFGRGVTRIPLNLVQKLRGGMEFWSSCCRHIRTECPVVDRLLSSTNGYSHPKGNALQVQNAFHEFWESIEFMRALFGSSEELGAPFSSTFL